MRGLAVVCVVMTVALAGIYVAWPHAVALLGFQGEAFFSGEFWRLFSFPLAHVSSVHVLENVIGLLVVSLLAYELDFHTKSFFWVFLLSGIVVALVSGSLFPFLFIAGASLGVFSIFGALSVRSSAFLPRYVLPLFFGVIIFLNFVFNVLVGGSLAQPAYHAAGFVAGAAIFRVGSLRKRKRVLTG